MEPLKHALALPWYLSRVSTLSISMGVFILLFDIIKANPSYNVFATRMIFFGFGCQCFSNEVGSVRNWWGILKTVAFFVLAVLPTSRLLALFHYLV